MFFRLYGLHTTGSVRDQYGLLQKLTNPIEKLMLMEPFLEEKTKSYQAICFICYFQGL